jgi:hypothetical protein
LLGVFPAARLVLAAALALSVAACGRPAAPAAPDRGGRPGIAAAAAYFLGTLSAAERTGVRSGLPLAELSPAGADAFRAVLRATLSPPAYGRVAAGGGQVTVSGEPSATRPWRWRYERPDGSVDATITGRHLNLRFTGGPRDDGALRLLGSLASTPRAVAVLGESPIDPPPGPVTDEGLPGSSMTPPQRAALLRLVTDRTTDPAADPARTFFAWYGPATPGGRAYYRISTPDLLIESVPAPGAVTGR